MAEQIDTPTKAGLIAEIKKSGLSQWDVEHGDGQLQYHLHSDEEKQHFDVLKKKLAEAREKSAADGSQDKLDTTHPGYLEDGTEKADFWLMACLRARKYNEDRALQLYDNYRKFRIDFGVEDEADADHEEMVKLLSMNYFRACGNQDRRGRFIFSMDVENYIPTEWSIRALIKCMHHNVSWLLIHHPEAQSRGVITIGNMQNWGMKNYNAESEKQMMMAMQNNIPMRDGGFISIHTPFMIRAIMPVVKMFMKKKMRDRMKFYKDAKSLDKHVDPAHLDIEYGGEYVRDMTSQVVDYSTWGPLQRLQFGVDADDDDVSEVTKKVAIVEV